MAGGGDTSCDQATASSSEVSSDLEVQLLGFVPFQGGAVVAVVGRGRVGGELPRDETVQMVVLEAVIDRHEGNAGPCRREQGNREERVVLTCVHERRIVRQRRCALSHEPPKLCAGHSRAGSAQQVTLIEPGLDHFYQ